MLGLSGRLTEHSTLQRTVASCQPTSLPCQVCEMSVLEADPPTPVRRFLMTEAVTEILFEDT